MPRYSQKPWQCPHCRRPALTHEEWRSARDLGYCRFCEHSQNTAKKEEPGFIKKLLRVIGLLIALALIPVVLGYIIIFALDVYDKISPHPPDFSEHAQEYAQLCKQSSVAAEQDTPGNGLIIVDKDTGQFVDKVTDDFKWRDYPDPASSPDKVRFVACLSKTELVVGHYGTCPAKRVYATIRMFDLRTGDIVEQQWDGGEPPDSIPVNKCIFGIRDVDGGLIKNWLLTVMQQ